MDSRTKRIIKTCCILLLIFMLLFGFISLFTYLMFPRTRFSLIANKNHSAKRVQYEVSEQLDALDLPKGETVILMGEYEWGEHFVIYANAWLAEDLIIKQAEDTRNIDYWAMKISGDTREVWYAEFPLEQFHLHPYTNSEQEELVQFHTLFTPIKWFSESWTDDSRLIGYCRYIEEKLIYPQ